MRHVAIVGSGPAGYYTAETLQKADDIAVDVIDRLPVPYGLIRTGVAPDHQSIKAVSRRYEQVALSGNVRFVGNISVGDQVTIAELLSLYDAVVLATGAPVDRALGIPGDDLQLKDHPQKLMIRRHHRQRGEAVAQKQRRDLADGGVGGHGDQIARHDRFGRLRAGHVAGGLHFSRADQPGEVLDAQVERLAIA